MVQEDAGEVGRVGSYRDFWAMWKISFFSLRLRSGHRKIQSRRDLIYMFPNSLLVDSWLPASATYICSLVFIFVVTVVGKEEVARLVQGIRISLPKRVRYFLRKETGQWVDEPQFGLKSSNALISFHLGCGPLSLFWKSDFWQHLPPVYCWRSAQVNQSILKFWNHFLCHIQLSLRTSSHQWENRSVFLLPELYVCISYTGSHR